MRGVIRYEKSCLTCGTPIRQGFARHRQWLRDAQTLTDLVMRFAEGAPIAALGIGAHGCDDKTECEAFENAFRSIGPLPVCVVNDAELMHYSYERYLKNTLRSNFGFEGTPIWFTIREKGEKER